MEYGDIHTGAGSKKLYWEGWRSHSPPSLSKFQIKFIKLQRTAFIYREHFHFLEAKASRLVIINVGHCWSLFLPHLNKNQQRPLLAAGKGSSGVVETLPLKAYWPYTGVSGILLFGKNSRRTRIFQVNIFAVAYGVTCTLLFPLSMHLAWHPTGPAAKR